MDLKEEEFKKVEEKLNKTQLEISELRSKEYLLKDKYVELLREQCKKNIGRCFEKLKNGEVIAYCKIIDIDKVYHTYNGSTFNEFQYPAIWFEYPYNDSNIPFYKDNLFSAAWGNGYDFVGNVNKISYNEISKEKFSEKFNEVNVCWINKIENN